MGGEPTFVAADDMESEQWRIAADGPDKRRLAAALAQRLRTHYAPAGLVHHGQGKWYPGEPLPRWQIAMIWRADGAPLWSDPDLLDDPWGPATTEPGSATARDLTAALTAAVARGLGVGVEHARAAVRGPARPPRRRGPPARGQPARRTA